MSERRSGNNLHRQLIEMFREARQKAPTDGGKSLSSFSLFLDTDPAISATWGKLRKSSAVIKIIKTTSLNNQGILAEALRKTLEVDRQTYQDGEMSGRES